MVFFASLLSRLCRSWIPLALVQVLAELYSMLLVSVLVQDGGYVTKMRG